jgi:hypothetical protein
MFTSLVSRNQTEIGRRYRPGRCFRTTFERRNLGPRGQRSNVFRTAHHRFRPVEAVAGLVQWLRLLVGDVAAQRVFFDV